MNICVIGLWHLGTVVAACLADYGHSVIGIDDDAHIIENLKNGQAPVSEPGLNELLQSGASNKHLSFSTSFADASSCEIVWLTIDTPVDASDEADLDFVRSRIDALLPHIAPHACLIISSQVPVGFTAEIASLSRTKYADKHLSFVYSPENLRLGKAIQCFKNPDRVILGSDSEDGLEKARELFKSCTNNFVCMSLESAEMTKHALNAFLGVSVTFINEIATLCELVGADAQDVSRGLKSEERIGPKAYLGPGAAFSGGTLARDVAFLVKTSNRLRQETPLLQSVRPSNEAHKLWVSKRIQREFDSLRGIRVAVLGLTYKPGTDTLRRSASVELCQWLSDQGAIVQGYDPALKSLPDSLSDVISLKDSISNALDGADAVVIANECPEFRQISVDRFPTSTKRIAVLDAAGFVRSTLGNDKRIKYISVGKP